MSSFSQFAPYLTHPLVLIGFGLWGVLGIHRVLLRTHIIPSLSQRAGARVVQSLLRYGFYIALLIILLGFGLAFYQVHLQTDPNLQRSRAEKARLDGLVASAVGFCQQPRAWEFDEVTRLDAARACVKAVDALAQSRTSGPSKEAALERLKNGDSKGAKALFQEILDQRSAEGKTANREAAEAARQIGALALVDNTNEALAAYRKAVELDPENFDGRIALGFLLGLVGQHTEAEVQFERARVISNAEGDRARLADSLLYLGWLHDARGHLGEAEEAGQAALAIDLSLDRKFALAADYRYLGDLQFGCGGLEKAETLFKKALDIDERGIKEATAASGKISDAWQMAQGLERDYGDLGQVYAARGDLDAARKMLKLSSGVNQILGIRPGLNNDCSCNLGALYMRQGDLDRAEEMFRKALSVDEGLGFRLGVAAEYSKLGDVYVAREKAGEARRMYEKSTDIYESLGYKRGVASNFRALGTLYMGRWFLDQSEAMLTKALEIDGAMQCKRTMAADFAAFGDLYHTRGDLARAEANYRKALTLLTEDAPSSSDAQNVRTRLEAIVARRTGKIWNAPSSQIRRG